MNTQSTTPAATRATPLRQRMIEDMRVRNLGRHSQRNHLDSCARFAAFLGRSPETATADDVRRFQLFLAESGVNIAYRNRIMTGVKFLFRVTLRRHDLAAEIYHLKEPQKIPLVLSRDEVRHLLAAAPNIKLRAMLSLAYGCGLRAGEVVRLRVGDIDSAQGIIRAVKLKGAQSKGRKDRNVMLPADICPNASPPAAATRSPTSCKGDQSTTSRDPLDKPHRTKDNSPSSSMQPKLDSNGPDPAMTGPAISRDQRILV